MKEPVIVRRTAALGDVVACTIVADRLNQLGHQVVWQCDPKLVAVAQRCPSISEVQASKGPCHCNLDGCYEKHPMRTALHLYTMIWQAARKQLLEIGIDLGSGVGSIPRLSKNSDGIKHLSEQKGGRPWIGIVPRSWFYNNRSVPDYIWRDSEMPGTKCWFGDTRAPEGMRELIGLSVESLMDYLCAMDLLVTVDTGPMHLAVAFGIPLVVVRQSVDPALRLPKGYDAEIVSPRGLTCLNCQQNICPLPGMAELPPCQYIDPEDLSRAVNLILTRNTLAA